MEQVDAGFAGAYCQKPMHCEALLFLSIFHLHPALTERSLAKAHRRWRIRRQLRESIQRFERQLTRFLQRLAGHRLRKHIVQRHRGWQIKHGFQVLLTPERPPASLEGLDKPAVPLREVTDVGKTV
ncbi:hypothetical protein D3C86_1464480 [compost metagenome]